MESSHQARKILERCLLLLLLGALAAAAWVQNRSAVVRVLTAHADQPVEITVLTAPAMFVSYTPATHQANVRVVAEKKYGGTPHERAQKLAAIEHISLHHPIKYFEPAQTDRDVFWADFKESLARWRYNPLLAARAAWAYITAWHNRRTNLSPAEFALLALEMTQLEANDFTVTFPPKKRSKKAATAPAAEQTEPANASPTSEEQDRPMLVEILNASGKKGLALELTQYLREQNSKGLLRVDVLQYDNYPSLQSTSWLENYSGNPIRLKQLGNAIGITGEIRTGNSPNVICETRIILGKDFTLPL